MQTPRRCRRQITAELAKTDFGGVVNWKLNGDDEEQAEAQRLPVQGLRRRDLPDLRGAARRSSTSSRASSLILSAIVLSTIGVFLGLMIMGQAFGIVMTGIGIIALAGVVTNNNIVLIDTYDRLRREGMPVEEAILADLPRARAAGAADRGHRHPRRAADRLRPQHRLHRTARSPIGAPSTQWWIQLSTAIVFGLGFATVLTLIVTPALLSGVAKLSGFFGRFRRRKAGGGGAAPVHARSNEPGGA